MAKRITCYKYIIRNNQETCFLDYIVTERYYSSQQEAEKDWNDPEHCFRVIKPFRISKQTGRMAEGLTQHERETKGTKELTFYERLKAKEKNDGR